MQHLPIDVGTPEFAERFGRFLRSARRERGMRIRHLSNPDLRGSRLREYERGRARLDPLVVSRLAGHYGADLDQLLPPREPLVLLATGTVAAGGMEESFEPGDVEAILVAYLRLIRRLRGDQPEAVVTLRRDDLIDIADQLGRPRPEIVDRVAVQLGATGDQRRGMVDLYLSGAVVIGLTN